jgi:hypothetical protein
VLAIQKVLRKDTKADLSTRIVYAADVVTGFMEDPLLAITTLGLPLDSIPSNIAKELGYNVEQPTFREQVDNLIWLFNNSPESYTASLEEAVFAYGTSFLDSHNKNGKLFIDDPDFESLRLAIKEDFLRKRVFPINNDRVSHGPHLAIQVGMPLLRKLDSEGKDALRILLNLTDEQALQIAVASDLVHDAKELAPTLPNVNRSPSVLNLLTEHILSDSHTLPKRELMGGLSGTRVFLVDASAVIRVSEAPQIKSSRR